MKMNVIEQWERLLVDNRIDGMTKQEAMRDAVLNHPYLHRRYLIEYNRRRGRKIHIGYRRLWAAMRSLANR